MDLPHKTLFKGLLAAPMLYMMDAASHRKALRSDNASFNNAAKLLSYTNIYVSALSTCKSQ
jgi:hypothetical protein